MRSNGRMDQETDDVTRALQQVGPRLRQARAHRGLSLVEVATATGISTSTLSRLENGQRRATLELLLPLATTYRIPLDDLVGAPDLGDPRVRLKATRRSGRTVLPLTRQPGGVQAWKIIVPASTSTPKLKAHEGFESLYVLSGRMRLVVGDRDVVLTPGETAEFDTRVPHWFGSTGDEPAEVLSMFGPQGEQVHGPAREAEAPGH